MTRPAAALVALVLATTAAAHERGADYTFGVAPFRPDYVPPAAGTYELPPIKTVGDHPVLDETGAATTLFGLVGERVAVISFVYTTCAESTGCPASTAVLHRLDRAVAAAPDLRDAVALVTVSFDPERDTPAAMAAARRLHAPAGDWRFATTADPAALRPLLDDFGQPVAKLRRADGSWTGLFRHVLKVFLVDRTRRVRNVYSVGLLDAQLVLNDVRTVLAAGPR